MDNEVTWTGLFMVRYWLNKILWLVLVFGFGMAILGAVLQLYSMKNQDTKLLDG